MGGSARRHHWSFRALAVVAAAGLALLLTFPPTPGGTGMGYTNQAQAATADPIIATVGDTACEPAQSSFNGGYGTSASCRQKYTSDLAVNQGLSAVLALGDNQYYCGGYDAFVKSYDRSWGRLKSITYPAVGNHEYLSSGGTGCSSTASGHYRYFGSRAGDPKKGYY
ncbi:MAG: hypothetical protein M3301_01105, partial [Chloroflexota bacterium]|nr:hypothetical protein [Chloroflexota bacterium]